MFQTTDQKIYRFHHLTSIGFPYVSHTVFKSSVTYKVGPPTYQLVYNPFFHCCYNYHKPKREIVRSNAPGILTWVAPTSLSVSLYLVTPELYTKIHINHSNTKRKTNSRTKPLKFYFQHCKKLCSKTLVQPNSLVVQLGLNIDSVIALVALAPIGTDFTDGFATVTPTPL